MLSDIKIDNIKKESDKMSQYYEMVMFRPFDLDDTTGSMILRIKLVLSKVLCLGSDARILITMLTPILLLLIHVDAWMESRLKTNIHCITDPLYSAYAAVINLIACSVTYYWGRCLEHYLKHDTNYHTTVRKMTRNILVPLDMSGFYRVMIWGGDPTTEFVRKIVKDFNLYSEYCDRQVRNGLTPQF